MSQSDSELNLDLITARLKEIQVGLSRLSKYKEFTEEEFLSSYEGIAASKYESIVVIEAASIICNHISLRDMNLGYTPEKCFNKLFCFSYSLHSLNSNQAVF